MSGSLEEELVQLCDSRISVDLFLHLSLIPAVLITVVLSFLQKRVKTLPLDRRLPFLEGRFAIVVPLDTIGSLSNRWSYGFAFGAVSSTVLLLFSESYVPFSVPPWARAIVYLVGALEVGLVYFPFFACLSTPCRTVGAVLGILYSLCWIVVTVWSTAMCPGGQYLGNYEKLIFKWPSIFSLIFLLGRFVYILVKGVRIHLGQRQADPEELIEQHQVEHVKELLRRTAAPRKPLSWFQRTVYEWDPHFKFPNRIIGTAIISLIGLYTMTLADYSLSDVVFGGMESWKDILAEAGAFCSADFNNSHSLAAAVQVLEEFIYVARKCWLATTIFASLNSVAYTLHILACYRKHLKRLWRGERSFIPDSFRNFKSATSVASITRYSGWQIGFTLWGYLIVHFVHFLFALLLAYVVVLPIIHGEVLTMLSDLSIIALTIGLVVALVVLQVVLVQVFFLQDKLSPTDTDKPLAINNRKAFHCFNYFFFFYNVVMGISTCILRLLLSIVTGTWLISRIDRTIMQRGYEGMDAGYSTWVGMIYADHHHNNPVMVCFCQLLLSKTLDVGHTVTSYSTFSNTSDDLAVNNPATSPATSPASRRWRLIYTLLKNPQLILLRKHNLSSQTAQQVALKACNMALQAPSTGGIPDIEVVPSEDC